MPSNEPKSQRSEKIYVIVSWTSRRRKRARDMTKRNIYLCRWDFEWYWAIYLITVKCFGNALISDHIAMVDKHDDDLECE